MKQQRGFIYLFSLGVVIILTVASASLLIRGVTESSVSERMRNQSAAFHNAEAGVDQAGINLRTPTDTADDTISGTTSTGTFTIDAPPTSLSPTQWQVTTHGVSSRDPTQPRNIEAVFQLAPQSVFQFSLFADQQLNVSGNAITDSYNSDDGPYEDDPNDPDYNAGHNGDIGTNATTAGGVSVGGSIFIDGQVAVGSGVQNPTSIVTGYNPAFITGGTSPPTDTQDVVAQSSPFPMPSVTVPIGLTCSNLTVAGNTTRTLNPADSPLGNGTFCYSNLTIEGNGTLTASGPVTIYLTGELTAQGNSTVGVVNDPTQMLFKMSSTAEATLEQTITGNNTFYSAIYGPSATINISGNAEIFGAVIAKTINVTGNAVVHYDEAMTELTEVSNLYKTTLISWREP